MSNVRSMNVAKGAVDTELKRTGTGIHTVEGNIAGARAARLTKQREADMSVYEAKKAKMQRDIQKGAQGMDSRFNTCVPSPPPAPPWRAAKVCARKSPCLRRREPAKPGGGSRTS